MKKLRIVPRNSVRELDAEMADRLVLDGGWLRVTGREAPTHARQQSLRRWRRHALARRAAGWRALTIWVSPELHARVTGSKQPGESLAGLLDRLLLTAGAMGGNSGTDTHEQAGGALGDSATDEGRP